MPVRYTIKHMQQFARDREGKCLSKDYVNDDGLLKWMCKKGHTWDASYTIIRQGGWCMQCAKNESGLEKLLVLQQIAKRKGGKCLSDTYLNNHSKLKWVCKENHRWEATAKSIKQHNNWCPYCSGNAPYTIKDMQQRAKEHNGKCISNTYIDSQTKLLWQCEMNHKWMAKPNSIFRGSWCAICSRVEVSKKQRNDISVYRRLAEKKGGRLISKECLRSRSRLEWKCIKNHVWTATGAQILRGSWCPYCAGKAKHTIPQMQQVAKSKGGKCLSKTYVNINSKLLWECKKKHRWQSIPSNILHNGAWCPVCAMDIKKFNLPQYHKRK